MSGEQKQIMVEMHQRWKMYLTEASVKKEVCTHTNPSLMANAQLLSFTYAEGEQSIHDSLEELADLLGDDEVPREIENGHVPKEETPESVTEPTPNPPHQKHTSPGIYILESV